MFKRCAVRNSMKVERSFVRKNYFFRAIADRQQLILHIIRKDILSFYNAMDLIFFTQFIKHCFGDAMLCCYLGFDNSSMQILQ